MGLLLAHKRTLKIYPDMLSISGGGGNHGGGGKRGEVSVFSPESRFRLFRLLHQLRFERVTFCTLTYPANFPVEAKIYKAHLKEYRRRFERLYGAVRAVWRLEFQKRGAPHYHIMYLDAPHIPVSAWCALWSDVIHTDDENHRKIGVDVKLVAGKGENRLIASYLAKYVAKEDERKTGEVDQKPGRWWGKWNIDEMPPIEVELEAKEAENVAALVYSGLSFAKWKPADSSNCTIFGDSMGGDEFEHRVAQIVTRITDVSRIGQKRKGARRKRNGL